MKKTILFTAFGLAVVASSQAATMSVADATIVNNNYVNANSTGQVRSDQVWRVYAAFNVDTLLTNEGLTLTDLATRTFTIALDYSASTLPADGTFRASYGGFKANGNYPDTGGGVGLADWEYSDYGTEVDSGTAANASGGNVSFGDFTFAGAADDGDLTNDFIIMGVSYNGPTSNSDFTTTSGYTLTVNPVPEPSSAALLGLGGLALILRRRK